MINWRVSALVIRTWGKRKKILTHLMTSKKDAEAFVHVRDGVTSSPLRRTCALGSACFRSARERVSHYGGKLCQVFNCLQASLSDDGSSGAKGQRRCGLPRGDAPPLESRLTARKGKFWMTRGDSWLFYGHADIMLCS
ncbi:hypothetical protein E2C01_054017 [Portunus trituberculatus]|uniref:Uncharacterized protein n=1 Tax=Portunus trituberculatus TaxID=210409 RepID=A0A5B7GQU1_PORTR|nr:hypothetical protein [Portunus trituberculatus]